MKKHIKNKIKEMIKALQFVLYEDEGKLVYDDNLDKLTIKILLENSLYVFTNEDFENYKYDEYDDICDYVEEDDVEDKEYDIEDDEEDNDEDIDISKLNMRYVTNEIATWVNLPRESIIILNNNNEEIDYDSITIGDIRNNWDYEESYQYRKPRIRMQRQITVNAVKLNIQKRYGIPYDSIKLTYPGGHTAMYISTLETLRRMWNKTS